MTIELTVSDVRRALEPAAGASAQGNGESANLLVGRIFHEIFADLVSERGARSGLGCLVESDREPLVAKARLLDHAYTRLLAPRLLRHRAALSECTEPVVVLWKALQELCGWLTEVTGELLLQYPEARGEGAGLARHLRAEVPLSCELHEPNWSEPVRLVGIADSLVALPKPSAWCAVELKIGRTAPVIDLGQAVLYHLILARTEASRERSALALLRFTPTREETMVEVQAVDEAQARLIDLIGRLAGVVDEGDLAPSLAPSSEDPRPTAPSPVVPSLPAPLSAAPLSPAPVAAVPLASVPPSQRPSSLVPPSWIPPQVENADHLELGRKIVRAFKEYGVSVELPLPPQVSPRFLRFPVRLTSGTRVDAVRRYLPEVQIRTRLHKEPLLELQVGRLLLDVERPDPQIVPFASILSQLAPVDPLAGSARLPIGLAPNGSLHCADLASAGRSHVLVAGTTGSGKTEWLRMVLAGLIATNTPETLRLITLDPKLVAFGELERSPFLKAPGAFWIPGSGREASEVFEDLVEIMERRYAEIRSKGVDNLAEYVVATQRPLPRLICICDEYFALIGQRKEEKARIENAISLLGAKGRAAGVHLILATQQPSRKVIQGALDANLPCRVGLMTSKAEESRMLLGRSGAEHLTGAGDLLYKDVGDPIRLQAPYLSSSDRAQWFSKDKG